MFEIKKAILDKIEEYESIAIFRHKRPDGDAVGSTNGLCRLLRLSYPDKDIRLCNTDFSDFVSFLGDEKTEDCEEFCKNALGIVLDTATEERVSSSDYKKCAFLIKIDHHIAIQSYADLEWVEEERSSCCELIADFYMTFSDRLKLDADAASCIYAGMVTDSGRFRFRSVSGETLRLAGAMLDLGVDLDHLYAHLYMADFESLKFKSAIYRRMKLTENGVAYVYIDRAMQEKFGLSFEAASSAVSYMDSIKNSLIWLAFIKCEDGTIRVRLRSRFVTVSELAESYGGGGHACAAGATVRNLTEMRKLVAEADALLGEYKRTHEGWL